MEKFNVAYRTMSGEIIIVEEEHENLEAAVNEKAKMFDFDSMIPGTYYTFTGADGAAALVNPKCIESIRMLKISNEKESYEVCKVEE